MTARRFGPYTLETSSEGKVLFPDSGRTKGDLIEYYQRIAPTMLRHMRGRPVTMHRFPDGIDGDGFYQKDLPGYFPKWIRRATVAKQGGTVTHALCQNAATLVYLANQACITPHIWLSRADRLHQPDRLVFDLDPSDDDFDKVRRAARLVAGAMDELGMAVFLQLTGSRGIHVVSPIRRGPDFDDVRAQARRLAAHLAGAHPDLLTVEQRIDRRGDRVYLDTARNAYAQTMTPPYAVRARRGAPVATPIRRDELDDPGLGPARYTIGNIFRRLARIEDPWTGLNRAARALQRVPEPAINGGETEGAG
ncbi:MAG: non-homologous end-joining DNA ligase [Phycisphaerales bacterium JB039]